MNLKSDLWNWILEGKRRSLLDIWSKGDEIEFPMIIDEGNKVLSLLSHQMSKF